MPLVFGSPKGSAPPHPPRIGAVSTPRKPLTPALSPSEGEREWNSRVFWQLTAAANNPRRTAFPPLPIRWGEGRGEGAAFGSGDRLVSRQRPTIPQSRATPWEYRHPVSPSPERAKPSPPAEKPAATWRSNPSGIGHSCPLRACLIPLLPLLPSLPFPV